MTQTEYEQKRHECWEEFYTNSKENLPLLSRYDVFCAAFDRVYALGKHGQKVFDNALGKQTETITQEDVEKAAQERADSILYDYRMEDMLRG